MTTIDEAVKATKRAAQQFRHLLQVGEYLEQVGSLEQAAREAAAKVEEYQSAMRDSKQDLANVRAELTSAQLQREAILGYVKKTKMEADSAGARVVTAARENAKASIAEAEITQDNTLRKIERDRAEHDKFMETAREDEQAITDRLGVLRLEIAEIKARL